MLSLFNEAQTNPRGVKNEQHYRREGGKGKPTQERDDFPLLGDCVYTRAERKRERVKEWGRGIASKGAGK